MVAINPNSQAHDALWALLIGKRRLGNNGDAQGNASGVCPTKRRIAMITRVRRNAGDDVTSVKMARRFASGLWNGGSRK